MTIPPAPAPQVGYAARLASWVRSPSARTWVLYLPICFVSSTLAISTWDVRQHGPAVSVNATGWALLIWLFGVLGAVGLHWRRRFPVVVAVALAVLTLVLPLDPMAALIAFGSLTVRRFDRVTAGVGGLTFLATLVSTWRDGQGRSKASSFWQMLAHSDVTGDHTPHEPLTWWVILAISVVLMALVFGVAMVVRDREATRSRRVVESRQQTVVSTLSDELARQAERERLAQEVHDALGHRLSLLSLHAGALELAAGEGRAAESAALVRENAQQSMADLRHLLAMLRHPDAPDVAAAVPTLADVGPLVDETLRTGAALVSSVHLEAVDRLDETTSRSAFRVTQELLTNARRHAPGIGVRVRVAATPATGIEIEVANHLATTATPEFDLGTGLRGIRSRVEQLGGEWRCWVDEHRVFRVAVHLPWVWNGQRAAPWQSTGSPGSVGSEA